MHKSTINTPMHVYVYISLRVLVIQLFCLIFRQYACSTDDIKIDKTSPKWYHYFLCGFKGILDHFDLNDPVGLCLLVDGTVPRSAGLSSSSAFVCAAALATMHANNKQCTKVGILIIIPLKCVIKYLIS